MKTTMLLADAYVDPLEALQSGTKQDQQQCERKQILDVPLITVNKLVFRSHLEKGTYKPVELLSYTDIVNQLKKDKNKNELGHPKKSTDYSGKDEGPSPLFMEKFQERKQRVLQEDDQTPPHPHPFIRNRRNTDQTKIKALTARSVLLEMSDEVEVRNKCVASGDEKNSELERKFENFMKWVNQAKQDYVAMETVNSIEEFQILFNLLEIYTSPTLLQIKLNTNGTWTVVCQPLEDFKKDYMVLRIGKKYCLCLEPF